MMWNSFSTSTSDTIQLAEQVFAFQTINEGRYVKPDVQTANEAFIAFQKNPDDIETVSAFRNAAEICKKYDRTGFKKLFSNLNSIYKELSKRSSNNSLKF